jgi:hypothetical protein
MSRRKAETTNGTRHHSSKKLEAFFINYYNMIIIDGLTIITEIMTNYFVLTSRNAGMLPYL